MGAIPAQPWKDASEQREQEEHVEPIHDLVLEVSAELRWWHLFELSTASA